MAHVVLFARAEADRLLEAPVAEHVVGEPEHVEDDVELALARPGEDVVASSRLVAKIVEAMPNWKSGVSAASACIASMVWQAFSKPRFTSRTWLWTSPMPSSDTRMLISTSRSAQNFTIRVSIGMARCGVSPVVLMPILRRRGSRFTNSSTSLGEVVAGGRLAARDVQVLDGAPERVVHDAVDLGQRHVLLAVAALPVAAHRAAGVTDERAVEDEDRRPDRPELRDRRLGQIARHADRGLGQVSKREGLLGQRLILSQPVATAKHKNGRPQGRPCHTVVAGSPSKPLQRQGRRPG